MSSLPRDTMLSKSRELCNLSRAACAARKKDVPLAASSTDAPGALLELVLDTSRRNAEPG